MVKPVLILEHWAPDPPGSLGTALTDCGIPWVVVDIAHVWGDESKGVKVPPKSTHAGFACADDEGIDMRAESVAESFAAVVVLGGAMGAYEEDEFSFLKGEKEWIAEFVNNYDTPFLGICLGCQVLADALGGKAYYSNDLEAGLVPLTLTEEGAKHPLLGCTAKEAGSLEMKEYIDLHGDTFDVPEGAVILAVSAKYTHAFEYKRSIGVQFHPEADLDIFSSWLALPESPDKLAAIGLTVEEVQGSVAAGVEATNAASKIFNYGWIQLYVLGQEAVDVGLEDGE